jgi:hypothetical protein
MDAVRCLLLNIGGAAPFLAFDDESPEGIEIMEPTRTSAAWIFAGGCNNCTCEVSSPGRDVEA